MAEPAGLRRLAGMPVLIRALRSFEKAGIKPVAVAAGPQIESEVKNLLSLNGFGQMAVVPDEQQALARVSAAGGEKFGDDAAGHGGESPRVVIVLRAGAAVDPVFLSDLVGRLRSAELVVPLAVGSECFVRRADGFGGNDPVEVDRAKFDGTLAPARTAVEARRAKRALVRACRKPMEVDGLVCYLLGRRLSGWISHVLVELPVTPNAVTAASLVVGLCAAAVTALGGYVFSVAGAALFFLSWVLDNCDGEMARVKHQGSTWGAWFDIYADFATNLAFVIGMAAGAYRAFGQPLYLVAGAYTAAAMAIYNGTVFRFIHRLGVPDEFLFEWWFDRGRDKGCESTSGEADAEASGEPGPSSGGRAAARWSFQAVFSVLKYAGRRDFFIFGYLVAALAGVLHWAFWATCLGATFTVALTLVHLVVVGRRARRRG